MNSIDHRAELVHILQMAFSGEKAAALAYAGHWRAARSSEERSSIARIEREEWEHRAFVGTLLRELDARPQLWREFLMGAIGVAVFIACFISGWYLPMYFAGMLEHDNVHEYLDAAKHAAALGLIQYEEELLHLAEVEQMHEEYFKNKVRGRCLTPLMAKLFGWGSENLEVA